MCDYTNKCTCTLSLYCNLVLANVIAVIIQYSLLQSYYSACIIMVDLMYFKKHLIVLV